MRRLSLLAIPALAVAGMACAQSPAATDGIAKADFQSMLRARMLKADTDGDGRISAAEWSAAAKARGKGRMGDRVFSRMDANGNGFIEAAELDAIAAKRFDKRDVDHDGRLSGDERKAMVDEMREKAGA
ncbi:signal transduction protein [Novosphingobium kaempferiae]|uniref:signal transduction protein n=1 Tax=Novosphingobium kaempferiae TaxID=2896849 RepID=UPI001E2AEF8C|nr:signal transduction protein [Novosphingobium kaempferiae]